MKSLSVLTICLFLFQSTLLANIIRVPSNYSTIQAGIDAATNGDTVLVADGTYTGAGNKEIRFNEKKIIVRSENGPQNCIIDCENSNNSFAFIISGSSENADCVVEGFTIRNGDFGFWAYANSSPTIAKNIIEGCTIGIWCNSEAAPLIIGNTIRNNNGGGISLEWSAAIIKNNIIYENSSEKGGAIYCFHSPSATIINNTIINNIATFGGGVYLEESPSMLTNNIIAFSKYKPALNLNIYGYKYVTQANYEGAKLTSIDYTFNFHNQGDGGTVNFNSTSSVGGKAIDTTFQMLTMEGRTVHINSKVNEFGDFGGVRLVITLNNDTLIYKADGPGFLKESYFLTLTMDSDAEPASKEIVEIGQGAEITFCDIFGYGEGNYYSGTSYFELERTVLKGTNGNISEDPLLSYPDYFLSTDSPCIDAGNPDASFNDSEIPPGMGEETCDIGAYGGSGNYIVTSIDQFLSLPLQIKLNQNYPNPFNPITTIKYSIPKSINVETSIRLNVYDVLGREIAVLVNEKQKPGYYVVEFEGKDLTSGIYFYRLQAGNFTQTKKMILLK